MYETQSEGTDTSLPSYACLFEVRTWAKGIVSGVDTTSNKRVLYNIADESGRTAIQGLSERKLMTAGAFKELEDKRQKKRS
jgi:hypothetical protein